MNNKREYEYTEEEIEKRYNDGLTQLCEVIAKTDDADLLQDFFHCLFTSAELKDFVNRWLLIQEIEKGTTQREIAKMFKMSLCKITRGSRELKKPESAFKKMLSKIDK
jgi:TrpR family trp operon transcriptional repressor